MIKNKYLTGLLVAASLVGPMTIGVAYAQDNANSGGSSMGTTQERRDNNMDWGWLGLLGLAGLAGMRRPATTHHTQEGGHRTA